MKYIKTYKLFESSLDEITDSEDLYEYTDKEEECEGCEPDDSDEESDEE